jgi:anti-sigma factor RsiW
VAIQPSRKHSDLQELLYLEIDGGLGARERRELAQHLTECRECRREKEELERLHLLLGESVVEIDDRFSRQIMERLPEAAWETRSMAGWRIAIVVFLLLAASAGILSFGGDRLVAEVPLAGTAFALFGLFQSALLAGAGLLAASWTGLGMALDRVFEGSRMAFAAFGLLVLGLDVLFVRLLLRYRASRVADGHSRDGGSES